MDILLHRLRKAGHMIPEAEEAARLLVKLAQQVEAGRAASQAMHYLTQAALTRGYDSIGAAIEAAPLNKQGREEW